MLIEVHFLLKQSEVNKHKFVKTILLVSLVFWQLFMTSLNWVIKQTSMWIGHHNKKSLKQISRQGHKTVPSNYVKIFQAHYILI